VEGGGDGCGEAQLGFRAQLARAAAKRAKEVVLAALARRQVAQARKEGDAESGRDESYRLFESDR